MAATDDTREALRQRLLVWRGSYCDEYCGTKAELIESGVAADGMFPGDPGCGKTQITHQGPPQVRICRKNKQHFCVAVLVDDVERERREEREAAQGALERARVEEQKELGFLPRSEDHFRAILRCLLMPGTGPEMILATRGGYRFPRSAVDCFIEAFMEALHELVDGQVLFDPEARAREIEAIKQKTARSDPGYQAQLASIVAGAFEGRADSVA